MMIRAGQSISPVRGGPFRPSWIKPGSGYSVDLDARALKFWAGGLERHAFAPFVADTGGTFTRASGATYFAPDGAIVSVASGDPAFSDEGLHYRAGMVNMLGTPETLSSWGGSGTLTQGTLGPDGVNYWAVLADASTSALATKSRSAAVAQNTDYCFAILVKKVPGASFASQIAMNFSGGTAANYRTTFNPETGAVNVSQATILGSVDHGDYFQVFMAANSGNNTAVSCVVIAATATPATSTSTGQSNTATGTISVGHAMLRVGTTPAAPINGTRAADELRIVLPPGTHDLVVELADGSSIVHAAQAGIFTVPPPVSDSPITRIYGAKVSDDAVFMTADYVDGATEWTDNTAGLLALMEYGAAQGYISLPPGTFAVDGSVELLQSGLGDLVIEGHGTELVFMNEMPQRCLNIGTPDLSGGVLTLTGDLTWRQGRPSVRTSGVQMINLRGMRGYDVDGITIPSADNMGLSIGVDDPNDHVADFVYVRYCDIGGHRYATRHTYGSIGDTAVWIITPGLVTRVQYNTIRETGDDAIWVGHNQAGVACDIEISHNDTASVAGGIGSSYPGARIFANTIDLTLNSATRLIDDNGLYGVVAAVDGEIKSNTITRTGHLTADDLWAEDTIPQQNPYPFRVGAPGCVIEDNDVDITVGTVGRIDPGAFGPYTVLFKNNRYKRIAYERDGLTPKAYGTKLAVYRRADSAVEATSVVIDGDEIDGTLQPLFDFFPAGTCTDHVTATLAARNVDFTTVPLAKVTATASGRSMMDITVDILDASPAVTLTSVSGGATSPTDVSVTLV